MGILLILISIVFGLVLPAIGSDIIKPIEKLLGKYYFWTFLGLAFFGYFLTKLKASGTKYYCAKCNQYLGDFDDHLDKCDRCGSNRYVIKKS